MREKHLWKNTFIERDGPAALPLGAVALERGHGATASPPFEHMGLGLVSVHMQAARRVECKQEFVERGSGALYTALCAIVRDEFDLLEVAEPAIGRLVKGERCALTRNTLPIPPPIVCSLPHAAGTAIHPSTASRRLLEERRWMALCIDGTHKRCENRAPPVAIRVS